MPETAVEKRHYHLWVCPDPACNYYETHCGMPEERFCPVWRVGEKIVHPVNAAPRLQLHEVTDV